MVGQGVETRTRTASCDSRLAYALNRRYPRLTISWTRSDPFLRGPGVASFQVLRERSYGTDDTESNGES
jgi:hypothetical protein